MYIYIYIYIYIYFPLGKEGENYRHRGKWFKNSHIATFITTCIIIKDRNIETTPTLLSQLIILFYEYTDLCNSGSAHNSFQ